MTTRMIHPQHGAMHAYDNGEVERLEKLGWFVEGSAPVAVVPVVEVAPPQKKKPGPKPKAK